jgi:cytochrome c-type biogenesis protein CcmH/NrfF
MSKTSELISKIAITFNDGSFVELVDTVRFIQIRDALRTASIVNNQLNEQARKLEEKIRELELNNKALDEANQQLISQLNTEVEFIQPEEFKNPLP